MKTNQLFMSLLLAGGVFTMNAQNVTSTQSLTSGGNLAGGNGTSSAYYGANAGKVSTGSSNAFIGNNTGLVNTTGYANTFLGDQAGRRNIDGSYNVFVGTNAGIGNTNGVNNTFLGGNSGNSTTTGANNTYVGHYSGSLNPTGSNNTILGNYAGYNTKGSGNIFIGYMSGYNLTVDNKLYITNNNTPNPLIWGDFTTSQLKLNGKVGIGGVATFPTTAGGANLSNYQLFIKGGVLAEEVRVATTWADYVFANNYALLTLEEVESFIATNGHLPNVPSAKQVAEEGISLGDIARIQQEKIEELTLYIIEQNKQLQAQQLINEQFKKQENEIRELKALVQNLAEKK